MLPSSVRRVVSAAHQSPLLSSFAQTGARATAAAAISFPRHQHRRRYSSSKPSSPNDSSRGIAAGQMTAKPTDSSAQSSKSGSSKSGQSSKSSKSSNASGEKRTRKTKDNSETFKLPSVPSTAGVPPASLAVASLFALYRPLSIYQGFPTTVTDEAFAQIFTPPTPENKKREYNNVVSTLSQTVNSLEQPMQNLSINGHGTSTDLHSDMKSYDGADSRMYIQINSMSGEFFPFRPPPVPLPQSSTPAEVGADEVIETEPQHRVYKALVTLEETTDSNGVIHLYAHIPQLVEEGGEGTEAAPRTLRQRMARRRQTHQEVVRGRPFRMFAISVRRQRKLKMKKKKYKKLMKRTRNERRKLDRI